MVDANSPSVNNLTRGVYEDGRGRPILVVSTGAGQGHDMRLFPCQV
jgi:hypothetical protein